MPNIKHGIYQGIQTIVIEDKQQIMSSTSLWFARGYALDDANAQGLSHFFEHLWAGGDDEYTKAKTLEEYGIRANAYTTAYLTYYYHVQESGNLLSSLQLLLNNFDQEPVSRDKFEKEKNIIAQEKANDQDNIYKIFTDTLYANTPLAYNVFGNLEAITYDQYIDYAQKHYTKEQSHLLIITPDIKDIILDSEVSSIESFLSLGALESVKSTNRLLPTSDNTLEVLFGYAILNTINLRTSTTLSVLRTALANFWTSVLLQELRIKNGLVYWIDSYSTVHPNSIDIQIQYKIDKENLLESLQIIYNSINNLESLITPQDIERYKTIYISDAKTQDGSIYEIQSFYGLQLPYNDGIHITLEDFYKDIRAISYEEVISLAKQFLSSHIKSLVIKGNLSEEEWVEAQKYI